MIHIRFVTGSDFISNAIRIGERDGWATHAEVVMPDGTLLGAHIDGGVQARPAGYDKTKMTRELIVELSFGNFVDIVGSGRQDAIDRMEDAFYTFLRAQLGKPYDVSAIAGLALDRDWRLADSWFCSELVAAALEQCDYLPKLSAADNHISPRDLLLVLSGRVPIANAA
jgi:hypothetical protein